MKRRALFLFFFLPFLGIFFILLLTSLFNRAYVQKRTEALVRGQLEATAGILGINIANHLSEGLAADTVLALFASEEDLYFIALLDGEKNVLAWNSRFEGYLPISLKEANPGESNFLDSPIGRIFHSLTRVPSESGPVHFLYLGYALTDMEMMLSRSKRTFLLLFGLLAAAGAVFFRGISIIQGRYMAKTREAEAERMEKERYRDISAFTSGVAHEIKNPLNGLALLLELLGNKVPPEMRPEVALGKTEIQNIGRTIDRFSDAAKPIRLSPRRITLGRALQATEEAILREFPDASSRLRFLGTESVVLRGDADLLVQAFVNFIKNALEASPESRVEVEIRKRKKVVEVEIRDTGPGIPSENLPRIFEPFYSTKAKGMGVGLYLAGKIIEAHGGRIETWSREGEGSRFLILLSGE